MKEALLERELIITRRNACTQSANIAAAQISWLRPRFQPSPFAALPRFRQVLEEFLPCPLHCRHASS